MEIELVKWDTDLSNWEDYGLTSVTPPSITDAIANVSSQRKAMTGQTIQPEAGTIEDYIVATSDIDKVRSQVYLVKQPEKYIMLN